MSTCVRCGGPLEDDWDTVQHVLSTVEGIAHVECPRTALYAWTDRAIAERLLELADEPENRGTRTGMFLIEAGARLRSIEPQERVISAEEFALFGPHTQQMIREAGVSIRESSET